VNNLKIKPFFFRIQKCSDPFIKNDYEFAVIKVKGQSFMLHQIRKMVGLVIAVVRGYASLETINLCWTANKVRIIQLLLAIIYNT